MRFLGSILRRCEGGVRQCNKVSCRELDHRDAQHESHITICSYRMRRSCKYQNTTWITSITGNVDQRSKKSSSSLAHGHFADEAGTRGKAPFRDLPISLWPEMSQRRYVFFLFSPISLRSYSPMGPACYVLVVFTAYRFCARRASMATASGSTSSRNLFYPAVCTDYVLHNLARLVSMSTRRQSAQNLDLFLYSCSAKRPQITQGLMLDLLAYQSIVYACVAARERADLLGPTKMVRCEGNALIFPLKGRIPERFEHGWHN